MIGKDGAYYPVKLPLEVSSYYDQVLGKEPLTFMLMAVEGVDVLGDVED